MIISSLPSSPSLLLGNERCVKALRRCHMGLMPFLVHHVHFFSEHGKLTVDDGFMMTEQVDKCYITSSL